MRERARSIHGQGDGVHRFRWKLAQGTQQIITTDVCGVGDFFSLQQLRQHRSAGNGGWTTANQKFDFDDLVVIDARSQQHAITARWVLDSDTGAGAGEFAAIARTFKMLKHLMRKHI